MLEKTVNARAVELATRDLAPEPGGDAEVPARRIHHVARRLVADGRLWDDRDAH
jgi:hypothetical protein